MADKQGDQPSQTEQPKDDQKSSETHQNHNMEGRRGGRGRFQLQQSDRRTDGQGQGGSDRAQQSNGHGAPRQQQVGNINN